MLPSSAWDGIRDEEHPCQEFVTGARGLGECEGDGHYLCYECMRLSVDSLLLTEGKTDFELAVGRRKIKSFWG
jgi:hypothetical protein